MRYSQIHLTPGEVVVLHQRPHWRILVLPLTKFAAVSLFVGILSGIVGGSFLLGWVRTTAFSTVGVLWGMALIWCVLRPLVVWASTHLVITNRRIVYRNGLIRRKGLDVPLSRINTVEFHRGILDRMMGSGTLVVESTANDPLIFSNIPSIERVYALLYHKIIDEQGNTGAWTPIEQQ